MNGERHPTLLVQRMHLVGRITALMDLSRLEELSSANLPSSLDTIKVYVSALMDMDGDLEVKRRLS